MAALQAVGLGEPEVIRRLVAQLRTTGLSGVSGVLLWAELAGDRCAIRDEQQSVSYAQLAERTRAIAAALCRRGLTPGSCVGILCRNHRHFIEAVCSTSLAGCHPVLLNTGFAGPQLREVLDREQVTALVYDEEFHALVPDDDRPRFVGHAIAGSREPTLDQLAAESPDDWSPTALPGRAVILTSGTTGTPKGARRRSTSLAGHGLPGPGLMSTIRAIGLRSGDQVYFASPFFHAWGANMLMAALVLGSTIVSSRKLDAESVLQVLQEARPNAMLTVPVVIQRVMELEPDRRKRFCTSSLRAVAVSGSSLPASLAIDWMDAFGDKLHNLYGSTETGPVAIAGPEDLREAPGTVGYAPRGSTIRLLDDRGHPVPTGETGRIFVHTGMLFDEYTGGGGKEMVEGLMCTGDLGRLDAQGRLFVEGRADEMIISGGENVFPSEIEHLLQNHPAIREAAAVGVPDREFGERLRAYIVAEPGASIDEAGVRDHVRAHLARYKVPRDVIFIEELPRNAAGKLLKRLLSRD